MGSPFDRACYGLLYRQLLLRWSALQQRYCFRGRDTQSASRNRVLLACSSILLLGANKGVTVITSDPI